MSQTLDREETSSDRAPLVAADPADSATVGASDSDDSDEDDSDEDDSDEDDSDEDDSDEDDSDEDDSDEAEDLPVEPHAILESEAQPLHLRIHMDPEDALAIADQFRLFSVDGEFEQILTSADDAVVGDEYIDLVYSSVPGDGSYSLEVSGDDHEPYLLFENVSFPDLDGYYAEEDDPFAEPLAPEDPEEEDADGLDSSPDDSDQGSDAQSGSQSAENAAAAPASSPAADDGKSGVEIDLGVTKIKLPF